MSQKEYNLHKGQDVLVGMKIPMELINAVDAWAKRYGQTRASALRLFIEIGLKRKG
jgi:predicted DNA-binding protein